MRGVWLLAVALLLPVAGCLGSPVAEPDGPSRRGAFGPAIGSPWPDGQSARDYIESYVMTHPFRYHGSPAPPLWGGAPFQSYMDDARDDLEAELNSFGLWTDRHAWASASDNGVNILAIQNGTTDPDQWVVLSAHYDTVVGTGATVYGAWDDGAGVAALLELARTLSQWDFPFTVVYAFFDGEEKGLLGSAAFVDDYFGTSVDLVANLNTDPPGLNWPCGDAAGAFPVRIIHEYWKVFVGAYPRYEWLFLAVEDALADAGVPSSAQDYAPGVPIATVMGFGLTGGSDHQSFGAMDIANVFLGSAPTTGAGGVAAAASYPLHTPLDTLEAMEELCRAGGAGTLADGLQTILDIFAYTLDEMAVAGVP